MGITNLHSKKEWRQFLKQQALTLTPEWKQQASLQICAQIENFLLGFAEQDHFAIFSALPEEPSLSSLELNPNLKSRLAYPQIVEDEMSFCLAQELVTGPFGILHPDPDTATGLRAELLKVIFVPALGFDLEGRRLGRGKGYYDRSLKDQKAIKVGVCFSPLLVDQLPDEDHDVRMDMVITEKRILKWK